MTCLSSSQRDGGWCYFLTRILECVCSAFLLVPRKAFSWIVAENHNHFILHTREGGPPDGSNILWRNIEEAGHSPGWWYIKGFIITAKSLQSCPTLCDPIDGSPPGSPIPGILQARTLDWAAISFSDAWKWKVKVKSLSCVSLLATPWTAAYQVSPSMGFSRQEYRSRVPLP